MALLMLLQRRMNRQVTVHGFRSAFRDWAGDEGDVPRELAEASLAHVVKDATEAAYRRRTAVEKRRKVMQAWGEFCSSRALLSQIVFDTAVEAGAVVQ
jgi:integrase